MPEGTSMQPLSDRTFRQIAQLMHDACGLTFAEHKKPLISSRLAGRIQRLGLAGFDDYLALLCDADDGGEFQMAVDLLTTNETYFFREPAHFELLHEQFPALGRHPLAVWSAACSFGDEVYSLAMLLADNQLAGRIADGWSVLGTDISERVLRSAAQGIYPQERLRHVHAQRLRRYCLRGEGESEGLVQIRPALRAHVRFGWVNLCRPIEPLGPFDVILLRNVLIYFDNATRGQVVERLLTQLRPGGLFFIGTAEGRVSCRTPLEPLRAGVFRKPARGSDG